MKKLMTALLLVLSSSAIAKNVIVNGTRFIYPEGSKEISVQLTNGAPRPALVQTWLDTGDASQSPDTIVTPFSITPPITRVEGNSGQTLRIRALDQTQMPKDRESIWYLNILEIPPKVSASAAEGKNVLQMGIRSRFKFIYRPENLGDRDLAPKELKVKANGKKLIIQNPSPFYITVNDITRGKSASISNAVVMIPPKSTETVDLNTTVGANEELTISTISDYGSTPETIIKTN